MNMPNIVHRGRQQRRSSSVTPHSSLRRSNSPVVYRRRCSSYDNNDSIVIRRYSQEEWQDNYKPQAQPKSATKTLRKKIKRASRGRQLERKHSLESRKHLQSSRSLSTRRLSYSSRSERRDSENVVVEQPFPSTSGDSRRVSFTTGSRGSFISLTNPKKRVSEILTFQRALRNSLRDSFRASFQPRSDAANSSTTVPEAAADTTAVASDFLSYYIPTKNKLQTTQSNTAQTPSTTCKVSFIFEQKKSECVSVTTLMDMVDFRTSEVASLVSELWRSCMAQRRWNQVNPTNPNGEMMRRSMVEVSADSRRSVVSIASKTKVIEIVTEKGPSRRVSFYNKQMMDRSVQEERGGKGKTANAFISDVNIHRCGGNAGDSSGSISSDAFNGDLAYTIVLSDGSEAISTKT